MRKKVHELGVSAKAMQVLAHDSKIPSNSFGPKREFALGETSPIALLCFVSLAVSLAAFEQWGTNSSIHLFFRSHACHPIAKCTKFQSHRTLCIRKQLLVVRS